jgi:hypothetical protein
VGKRGAAIFPGRFVILSEAKNLRDSGQILRSAQNDRFARIFCRAREKKWIGFSHGKWYNRYMTDFGKGPTLEQVNPWLRNEAERVERILDVTERNSVIEGLPPFSEEMRRRLREELTGDSSPVPTPGR